MWQLDDDTVLQPDTFGVLLRMLEENPEAGIAGALYTHKGGDEFPLTMWIQKEGEFTVCDYYHPWELTGGVMEVGVTGGGCMLFRMNAFEGMLEPFFWNEADLGTDVQICMRMREQGWKVLCHTGHELGHVGDRKIWYPSTIDDLMAEINAATERLYHDVIDFLGLTPDQFRAHVIRAQSKMRETWMEMKPEDPAEVMAVYEVPELADSQVARNAFYNMKKKRDRRDLLQYMRKNGVKGKRGLDYGCGIGTRAEMMAREGMRVLALDLPTKPIDFLEWRAKRHGFVDNLELLRLDGPDGTKVLPDYNFDIIVLMDVLEHLMEPHKVLREMLLRLNPGGLLVSNAHVHEFKGKEEGNPQHLKLISDEEFVEICMEYGVVPWHGCLLKKEA